MNLRAKRELTDVAQYLIGAGTSGPGSARCASTADLGRRILDALRIADEPDLLCPVCNAPVSSPDHTYAEQGLIPVIGCPQVSVPGFILTHSKWSKGQ